MRVASACRIVPGAVACCRRRRRRFRAGSSCRRSSTWRCSTVGAMHASSSRAGMTTVGSVSGGRSGAAAACGCYSGARASSQSGWRRWCVGDLVENRRDGGRDGVQPKRRAQRERVHAPSTARRTVARAASAPTCAVAEAVGAPGAQLRQRHRVGRRRRRHSRCRPRPTPARSCRSTRSARSRGWRQSRTWWPVPPKPSSAAAAAAATRGSRRRRCPARRVPNWPAPARTPQRLIHDRETEGVAVFERHRFGRQLRRAVERDRGRRSKIPR